MKSLKSCSGFADADHLIIMTIGMVLFVVVAPTLFRILEKDVPAGVVGFVIVGLPCGAGVFHGFAEAYAREGWGGVLGIVFAFSFWGLIAFLVMRSCAT